MYAANSTRPDISYAVGMAARSSSAPTDEAIKLVKRILRYLYGTQHLGITYHRYNGKLNVEAYSDSNWAGVPHEKARSTTGIVIKINGGAIFWQSVRQHSVSLSSAEAEYIACSEAGRELLSLRHFLEELSVMPNGPLPLFVDNQTAILMTEEEGNNDRRKHINVRYHWIRDQVTSRLISVHWVETKKQEADLFTKPLPPTAFEYLRDLIMGVATNEHQHSTSSSSSSQSPQ